MKKRSFIFLIFIVLYFFSIVGNIYSENQELRSTKIRDNKEANYSRPSLYIDNSANIDEDYIKSKIIFVNYVIEPQKADIVLIISYENTASEGKEYTLRFIGQNDFKNINYKFVFYTKKNESTIEIQNKFDEEIKRGLVPYILNLPIYNNIYINYII